MTLQAELLHNTELLLRRGVVVKWYVWRHCYSSGIWSHIRNRSYLFHGNNTPTIPLQQSQFSISTKNCIVYFQMLSSNNETPWDQKFARPCVLTQREFSEQIQDPFCYNTVIKKRYDSIIYFIKFSSQLFNLFQSSYLLNNVYIIENHFFTIFLYFNWKGFAPKFTRH